MHLIPVVSPDDVRAWDARAVAAGLSVRMLMEQAGRAVAQAVVDRHAQLAGQGVLVACGSGQNGSDGWVAARALHTSGLPVWVAAVTALPTGAAAEARTAALSDGVRTVQPDGPWPNVGLVVDALLGTGAQGAPRAEVAALLRRLGDIERPIVAVDGPTGLDLDTGLDHGALPTALTVTFGGVRRGHLLSRDECGDILVADIGLPAPDNALPQLVSRNWCADRLRPFPSRSHKGTRGRVVIVGGSLAMIGAARLAARSAFASGAGLVHIVAPEDALAAIRIAEPDVQTMAQEFDADIADNVAALLDHADVVAIGPGLGRDAGRAKFVLAVLAHAKAAVIDADALTVLKPHRDALAKQAQRIPLVCTPHIGEFRTLFGEFAGELETDPWSAASAAANASHATVLLKGVPTVVASPNGGMLTVAAGNPGLATGGSGDLLTGILAALVAQGIALPDAAAMAAQAHGEAADHAARRHTARAMRPMDVITSLPDVWRTWQRDSVGVRRFPWLATLPSPRVV